MNKWINIFFIGEMNETTEDKLRDATLLTATERSTEEIMTKHFLLHFITPQNEAPGDGSVSVQT